VIAVAVGAAVVVLVVVLARGRRTSDVQRVQVEARPWAGPARLNGRASVRLPAALPRGPQLLDTTRRPRVGKVRPRMLWLTLAGAVGVWLALGMWLVAR
jgi:hypothetical protein